MNIVFEGIDDWNRPVFKSVDSNERFGSVEVLFDYSASEDMVLEQIGHKDLTYFGRSFNCEPMGSPVTCELNIVKKKEDI